MTLNNIITKIFDKPYNKPFKLYDIYLLLLDYNFDTDLSPKINLKLQHIFQFFTLYSSQIQAIQNKPFLVYFDIYYQDDTVEHLFIQSFHYFLLQYLSYSVITEETNTHITLEFDINNLQNIEQLIQEINTNSFITDVSFLIPLKKNNYVVSDIVSVHNEPRRLIYGWNKETGNQLHKYLPPDFDEFTNDINEYIRIKQKEYYVAIIDDGCVTNYTDYQVISQQNDDLCHFIDPTTKQKKKITRYYDDFANVDSNTHFTNTVDTRDIILKDTFHGNNLFENITDFCDRKNVYTNIDYAEHGTRVTSCCAGYKFGIAPNVNIISYSVIDDNNMLGGKISTAFQNIEDEIKLGKKIIAVNKSLGPALIKSQHEIISNTYESIKTSNTTVYGSNNFVYTISAGNDNDDVSNIENIEDIYKDNLNVNSLLEETKLLGFNTRFDSKKSNYKSYYTSINDIDPQLKEHILSVGSFDIFYKELENYSSTGHPYFYYNKPDLLAPSYSYGTSIDGSEQKNSGTSFSSPMMCGLVVLVRCLIDYLIEFHNFPQELTHPDRITHIIKESSFMFSNGVNNIYYTKFDQGKGFCTLFNVYKYLKSQNKSNFTSPFYNNSLLKTTYEFKTQDTPCLDDTFLDSQECLEYAYNFVVDKEKDQYDSVFDNKNNFIIQNIRKDYVLKKSYPFTNKYEENSQCFLRSDNKVFFKKDKGGNEQYVCKETKHIENITRNPKCYKRKTSQSASDDIVYGDILIDEHKNNILVDCLNSETTPTTYKETFFCENMNCLGQCDDSETHSVNKYGECKKIDKYFNIKQSEIILRDNKYVYIYYMGLSVFILCIIISVYIIIKR